MSEKNLNDNTDPTWKIHMETLMKKKRILETKEIIEQAIWEYYFEKGLPVPRWRMQKDPQWWSDYLEELNDDRNN
jgi:hypothetical protein